MSAFKEAIAREVRKELMNPEFDSRRSKNGGRVFWVKLATATGFAQFVKEHPPYDDNVAAVHETMSGAAAAVVADRGDEVRITEGYVLTLPGPFCLATSGVRWVGEGHGTKVPVFTVQNATHGISLDAAGVELDNVRFAAPSTDEALSMIRIKGAGCKVQNIVGIGADGAKNFVDCITVGLGSHDLELKNIRLTSLGGAPVGTFLTFENPISRFFSAGFYASGSVGTAGVVDDANANLGDAIISNWRIAVGGVAKPALTLDATKGKGIVTDCHFAGTHGTLANNAQFAGDWRLSQVYVSEETGNVAQGALIPAVDAD